MFVHVIGGAGIPRRFDAKREENNVGSLHVASQGTQRKCDRTAPVTTQSYVGAKNGERIRDVSSEIRANNSV